MRDWWLSNLQEVLNLNDPTLTNPRTIQIHFNSMSNSVCILSYDIHKTIYDGLGLFSSITERFRSLSVSDLQNELEPCFRTWQTNLHMICSICLYIKMGKKNQNNKNLFEYNMKVLQIISVIIISTLSNPVDGSKKYDSIDVNDKDYQGGFSK